MKFPLKGELVDRPCFRVKDDMLELIDQRMLPSKVRIIYAASIPEQVECIRTLAVRGAPAIGAFGAYSLALAAKRGENVDDAYKELLSSRPTAVDLRNCMDRIKETYHQGKDALESAASIYNGIIDSCRRIGEQGARVIGDGARVMTHCNAGALASIDWGTALAPIRVKAREGGDPFVWVSETRPLLQGSRLTAWELLQEGIDHRIVVDGASGYLLAKSPLRQTLSAPVITRSTFPSLIK
ncbi:MAG: S-methyl-5-thioribose-1-phosphate isomerase, partial [Candidatus Thermoplasmatota archaeon]|nr:S-methyl-5-thioribose-1-phosphate isomerase [Candidatus Thermoplasmatota archaeon]